MYSSTSKRTKVESTEIKYSLPSKPLDFSFREIKVLEDLIKAEPRSGVRKALEEHKDEKNPDMKKKSNVDFEDINNQEKEVKRGKGKEVQKEEIVEGKIFSDETAKNKVKGLNKQQDDKVEVNSSKRKIKYLTYTNSIILHSNQIKSLQNIDKVLVEVVPEVDFLQGSIINENMSKIDLIQWLDLSHNKLESIHKDITNLKFLKILYLHANYIQEIEKMLELGKCKCLINLTLHGNPIEQIKGYRHFIIEIVSSLEKFDFTLVSEKELDIIHFKGSRYGEKRKNGKVISYPKLDIEILKRMHIPKNDENDKKEDDL